MNNSAFIENLRQLFAECDSDNNGSLGRDEFGELCDKIGLNDEAADETFKRLDLDKDGRITFEEFANGFNQYSKQEPAPVSHQNDVGSCGSAPQVSIVEPASSRASTVTKTGNRSPTTSRQQQKISPSPVAMRSGRISVSPLGVMSLGSSGSSNNLTASRSTSTGGTGDLSSYELFNVGEPATTINSNYGNSVENTGSGGNSRKDSVVVYSSEMIPEYDQAGCSSGQFGSWMSSNGSLNQLRNMQDLLDCVQKLQNENQVLSQIFFKDKREREEYISQLGEEFDQQVREVEERANRRAKEELESEKKRLREMMQAERETLQHHYQTIEKMSKLIKMPNGGKLDDGENIDLVRSKLEDTYLENRRLKKSLLDTKTDVAMIWKEMEKLKKQYEDKLSSAYERNNETRNECDHIKQQLNLMKDSNRKLQDASDVITTYITDKVEPVIKSASGVEDDMKHLAAGDPLLNSSYRAAGVNQTGSRRGSILSEYLDGDQSTSLEETQRYENSIQGDVESLGSNTEDRLPRKSNQVTTLGDVSRRLPAPKLAPIPPRSSQEPASSSSVEFEARSTSKTGNPSPAQPRQHQSVQNSEASLELNSAVEKKVKSINESNGNPNSSLRKDQQEQNALIQSTKQSGPNKSSSIKNLGRHIFTMGSRAQSDAQVNDDKVSCDTKAVVRKTSLDTNDEPIVEPADGPSKATFNIILVGDSFVGKSSFAARFMEGSFVQGLISNCSIDFKTKAFKVDGINYTVNLWDTAGQERFRSITASYFRKADGIILMYDVTDKRSYLNVRNWMSTISETASENVAVLLVGNKIDLRQRHNMNNCVPSDEGLRLAKEYMIVFLETSVKTGTNLVPSMGKLIRLIAKNNEPVEEDTDRIRLNDKSKTFNCMPKNC